MSFLICLLLSGAVALGATGAIKKHANGLYVAAAVLELFLVIGTALEIDAYFPRIVDQLLWNPLTKGSLGTALFVLVMYAGALPNRAPVRKKLMSIRGELSILAGILTLGHNLCYGQVHFVQMVTDPASMSIPMRMAATCSILMIAILVPLFLTSFPAVRKKMKARSWKKLQRLAYGFYALTYLHVLALFVPVAAQGNRAAIINVVVFTVVFLTYGAMRIRKAMKKHQWIPVVFAAAAAAAVLVAVLPVHIGEPVVQTVPESSEPSESSASAVMPEESYLDGVYEGRGKGYVAPIRVRVTVAGGRIETIEVLSHEEDEAYWTSAQVMFDRIREEQSTDVDTVSGATSTCKGILKAVRDALKQAQAE